MIGEGSANAGGQVRKKSSQGSFDLNTQLLPKAVIDRIKETKGSLPITANTLANYRNFQLQKQKEAESNLLNKDISQVLVISTGGTFCMVKTSRGYMVSRGLAQRLKKFHSFYDDEMAALLELPHDTLITPETPYHKRVQFTVLEFEELIDSSNIMVSDWVKIAKTIEENYKKYDGFVVLHGTDTMAYTASALSFMLENLNKTVIITGS
jgi:lysophospholipase